MDDRCQSSPYSLPHLFILQTDGISHLIGGHFIFTIYYYCTRFTKGLEVLELKQGIAQGLHTLEHKQEKDDLLFDLGF